MDTAEQRELIGELLKHIGRFICGAISQEELVIVLKAVTRNLEAS